MNLVKSVAAGLTATLLLIAAAGCGDESVTAQELASKAKAAAQAQGATAPDCCAPPARAEAAEQAPADDAGAAEASSREDRPAKPQAVESDRTPAARASEFLPPSERIAFDLDYGMTDQDGRSLRLSALRGRPMAVTFLYTSCPLPTMCPLIAARLGQLQRDVREAGLADQVRLVAISYDPTRDTPEALHAYGTKHGLSFDNAVLLRPDADDLRGLLSEFQIGVEYYANGSINHFIEMILIDREGRFVRDYTGQIWNNAAVLDDLRRLAAE